ncbi:MFS transporter, partial [Candidatus Marsarchaeota G2 archaeon ECH_B_SAG-C16]
MKAGLTSLLVVFLLSAAAVYSISFVLPNVILEFGSAAAFSVPLSWVGGAVGGVVLSMVGDVRSRKYALLVSILLFTLPLGLNIRMGSLIELLAVWFLIGFGVNGENGLSYVYAAELSSPQKRGFIGSVMQGLYYLGGITDLVL